MKRACFLGMVLLTFQLQLTKALALELELAGNDAGGGAGAVVCREQTSGAIQSAEVLDLFEARASGIELRSASGDDEVEYLAFLDARQLITTSIPVSRSAEERVRKLADFHKTVRDYYRYTMRDERVTPTRDFGRLPQLPRGCRVEQLARFDDHQQMILIDSEIWSKFDSLNRVALFAHEFLYRRYRNAGEVNSELVRKLLGAVFALQPRAYVRDGVPEGALFCRGGSLDLMLLTEFYLFRNPLRSGETVLQFASVSGRETLWPTRAYLPFSLAANAIKSNGNDAAIVVDPKVSFSGVVPLEGGPLAVYSVKLRFEFNEAIELTLFRNGLETERSIVIGQCQIVSRR
jgi:hypothetical protein